MPFNLYRSDDKHITTKLQHGTLDQAAIEQFPCTFRARFERAGYLVVRQLADVAGDEARAQIVVRLKLVRWFPDS